MNSSNTPINNAYVYGLRALTVLYDTIPHHNTYESLKNAKKLPSSLDELSSQFENILLHTEKLKDMIRLNEKHADKPRLSNTSIPEIPSSSTKPTNFNNDKDIPSTISSNINRKKTGKITCERLYSEFVSGSSKKMIIDVRPADEFIGGHITCKSTIPTRLAVVNIDLFSIDSDTSLEELEDSINRYGIVSAGSKDVFHHRKDYEIIIVNTGSISDSLNTPPDIYKAEQVVIEILEKLLEKEGVSHMALAGGYGEWKRFITKNNLRLNEWIEIGDGSTYDNLNDKSITANKSSLISPVNNKSDYAKNESEYLHSRANIDQNVSPRVSISSSAVPATTSTFSRPKPLPKIDGINTSNMPLSQSKLQYTPIGGYTPTSPTVALSSSVNGYSGNNFSNKKDLSIPPELPSFNKEIINGKFAATSSITMTTSTSRPGQSKRNLPVQPNGFLAMSDLAKKGRDNQNISSNQNTLENIRSSQTSSVNNSSNSSAQSQYPQVRVKQGIPPSTSYPSISNLSNPNTQQLFTSSMPLSSTNNYTTGLSRPSDTSIHSSYPYSLPQTYVPSSSAISPSSNGHFPELETVKSEFPFISRHTGYTVRKTSMEAAESNRILQNINSQAKFAAGPPIPSKALSTDVEKTNQNYALPGSNIQNNIVSNYQGAYNQQLNYHSGKTGYNLVSSSNMPAIPMHYSLLSPVDADYMDPFSSSQGHSTVGRIGLHNLGNSCFMNSVIQCLVADEPLARFFRSGLYKQHVNRNNSLGTGGVLADSYAELIQQMFNQFNPVVNPKKFKETIGKLHSSFSSNDQQDSQEFLSFLLDGLHEDMNEARTDSNKSNPRKKSLFGNLRSQSKSSLVEMGKMPTSSNADDDDDDKFSEQELLQRSWKRYRENNWSIMVDMFQGILRSKCRCLVCGKTSTTFNPFMYLSLPIPEYDRKGRKGGAVYLQECLDDFVKEEVLSGDDLWRCSRCKKPQRSTKTLTLTKLPPVLLVHLKRFYYQGPFRNRIDTYVEFPLNRLDLTSYVPKQFLNPGETFVYNLKGVSSHYGGLSGGHYMAQVRDGPPNSSQTWLNFDDTKVSPINEKDVKTSAAYILFYIREVPKGFKSMERNWWSTNRN